jgi:hypothetical protein
VYVSFVGNWRGRDQSTTSRQRCLPFVGCGPGGEMIGVFEETGQRGDRVRGWATCGFVDALTEVLCGCVWVGE